MIDPDEIRNLPPREQLDAWAKWREESRLRAARERARIVREAWERHERILGRRHGSLSAAARELEISPQTAQKIMQEETHVENIMITEKSEECTVYYGGEEHTVTWRYTVMGKEDSGYEGWLKTTDDQGREWIYMREGGRNWLYPPEEAGNGRVDVGGGDGEDPLKSATRWFVRLRSE